MSEVGVCDIHPVSTSCSLAQPLIISFHPLVKGSPGEAGVRMGRGSGRGQTLLPQMWGIWRKDMSHVEAGSHLALGKRTLVRTQAVDLLEGMWTYPGGWISRSALLDLGNALSWGFPVFLVKYFPGHQEQRVEQEIWLHLLDRLLSSRRH